MSTNHTIFHTNSNHLKPNGVQVSTIVQLGGQWVKVTPLLNNQALLAKDAKQANAWGKALEIPTKQFAERAFLGNYAPTGELDKDFAMPGKTTIIATPAGMDRYAQDGHRIERKAYDSNIAVLDTFDDYGRAIMGVVGNATMSSKAVSAKLKPVAPSPGNLYDSYTEYDTDIEDFTSSREDRHSSYYESEYDSSTDSEDSTSTSSSYPEPPKLTDTTDRSSKPEKSKSDTLNKPALSEPEYSSDEELSLVASSRKSKTEGANETTTKTLEPTRFKGANGAHKLDLTEKQQLTLDAVNEIFTIYKTHLAQSQDREQAFEDSKATLRSIGKKLNTNEALMHIGHSSGYQKHEYEAKKLKLMATILMQDIKANMKTPINELHTEVMRNRFSK